MLHIITCDGYQSIGILPAHFPLHLLPAVCTCYEQTSNGYAILIQRNGRMIADSEGLLIS